MKKGKKIGVLGYMEDREVKDIDRLSNKFKDEVINEPKEIYEDKCYNCSSEIKDSGSTTHVWYNTFKCGARIGGMLGGDDGNLTIISFCVK